MSEQKKSNVRTFQGFFELILDEIRKVDSGTADLDHVKAKHMLFKDGLALSNYSLQAARMYQGRKDIPADVPMMWSPEHE